VSGARARGRWRGREVDAAPFARSLAAAHAPVPMAMALTHGGIDRLVEPSVGGVASLATAATSSGSSTRGASDMELEVARASDVLLLVLRVARCTCAGPRRGTDRSPVTNQAP